MSDRTLTQPWKLSPPDTDHVADFIAGPGINRLETPTFDIERLKAALDEVSARAGFDETFGDHGLGTLPMLRRPGTTGLDLVDLSGRFWLRPDDRYQEIPRDDVVDEHAYTELVPEFAGTYFEEVLASLRAIATIGRVRLNLKEPFNTNSFHRDPEPRLHVPITTNPGCLFIVNNHCTHLPADGSVYFTDTRGYHTALNGGDTARVHLVATLID